MHEVSFSASSDADNEARAVMRTTVTIDDDLLARAIELTGVGELAYEA